MESTQEIVIKILSKEESGLTLLYDNYAPILFGIILRIVADS
jgi:hypothetical protein